MKAAHYGIEDTRSGSISYKKLCPGTYLFDGEAIDGGSLGGRHKGQE